MLRRGADPLSPARVFILIWSLAIALTEFKFSGFQHEWNAQSWALLLLPIWSFILGTFTVFVLNADKTMMPIPKMRHILSNEVIREGRLFWLICLITAVYLISYLANFLIKGWLPIEAAERHLSRVEFNITGLSFLTYLVPSIIVFVVLYFVKVQGSKKRKLLLVTITLVVMGSFLLFVARFQIIMILVLCTTLLYYTTRYIRLRTGLVLFATATAFFYGISLIRLSHVVATYLYSVSKMKFSRDYAFFTEPYMYLVMNLENYARAVNKLDYHTYGYYTFEFVTAMSGLKYWAYEYFGLERFPFLVSNYNTYSALWPFYSDFGVLGIALIPFALGFGIAMLYYRMRRRPSLQNVTAYGVSVFVIVISFFVFPVAFFWFQINLLVIYFVLRWTVVSGRENGGMHISNAIDGNG